MADERWEQVQELFEEALRQRADERAAFLDEACGNDPDLCAEVASMLRHHQEASTGFMESPPEGRPGAAMRVTSRPEKDPLLGQQVGHYRIKSVIGSGGMGTVYLAQQEHPRRTVALKLMKKGIASRSALRRFEYESQILGRLRHPGIAQVYEAGAHDDGSGGVPYFAMEYIPNAKSIIDYANGKKLNTRERLHLFAKVCDAVHHGHQKGIIHRDLKPGNILVDSSGGPKIIDFGVARSTDSDMAVTTLQTDIGQLIGTLQYMSPEQCDADPHDLDTRSDVYALGVVLYELLCGQTPYDVTQVAVYEAARVIREAPPARPSTINRTLRGDVETIALKALEKNRERRYKSAEALGTDIARYLNSEPIEARPPSLAYQVRMFARRNRTVFVALMSVVSVLAIATAVSLVFLIQASIARDDLKIEVEQRKVAEKEARGEAVAARMAKEEAQRERDAARFKAYLANIAAADAAFMANDVITAKRRLRLASEDLRNWEWRYLWSRSDTSLATLRGHEDSVYSVAFSPDGTRLASGSADGTGKLWNAADGEEVATLRGHEDRVFSVAFSPSGTRLASGSGDGTIKLWDATTGEEVATIRGHEDLVTSVAFSPDGTRMGSGSGDGTIMLWDTGSGEQVATLLGHRSRIVGLAFSPDGTRVASNSWGRKIRLWDAATGEELATTSGLSNGSVAFSPDGTRVASGSSGATRLWDVVSGEYVAILRGLQSSDYVGCVAFSPDGRRLASGSRAENIRLYSVVSGGEFATLRGHEDRVFSVAFSPDGTRLASGSGDGTIKLWDAAGGENITTLNLPRGLRCDSVAFSPDGTRVVSRSNPGVLILWDAATGELLATLGSDIKGPAFNNWRGTLAFSPDGTRVAVSVQLPHLGWDSPAGSIRLWNAVTGEEVTTIGEHLGLAVSMAFSPDGTRLASGSPDGTIRLWDATNGEELTTMREHEDSIVSVAFSGDGTRLVSASSNMTIKLWDAVTGEELATMRGCEDSIVSVAFSGDGTRLVSASSNMTIKLWDAATGEELATMRGHEDRVSSVAFSPDGTRLVSGSADETIKLWDAATGEELATLRGHDLPVQSVAFSPDGTRLVSGSTGFTIRLWDSMPLRERRIELDLYNAAMELIAPRIGGMFADGLEPTEIAEQIRNDQSLSDMQRRAALNLILKRCSDMRERRAAD